MHGEIGGITGVFKIKEEEKKWSGVFENNGKK